jgi:vitellogenic carboxypeptidase-like protein
VFVSDPLPIQTSCFNTATVTGASTVAPQQIIMWSGYANIGIQNSNSALAFIFVGALAAGTQAKNLANYPTMIWMNGGPGASSQIGNFLELGPFRYDENTGMLSWNNHTWAQNINVIFIDQPIGAGFSYIQNLADAPTSVANSTQQLYNGLVQMFTNPNGCFASVNLIKSPLFIAGESYAGKFVPAIAN